MATIQTSRQRSKSSSSNEPPDLATVRHTRSDALTLVFLLLPARGSVPRCTPESSAKHSDYRVPALPLSLRSVRGSERVGNAILRQWSFRASDVLVRRSGRDGQAAGLYAVLAEYEPHWLARHPLGAPFPPERGPAFLSRGLPERPVRLDMPGDHSAWQNARRAEVRVARSRHIGPATAHCL